MRRWTFGAVLAALAVPVLAGCRPEADDGSARERARSRAAVQQAERALVAGAETALPARAHDPVAGWEGCASSFPEGWATVRWRVEARLDLARDARARPPYLAPLRAVLADAGFGPVSRAPGHAPSVTLEGERSEVEASVTHTGAGRFVLVTVRGPCVAAGDAQDGVR